MSGSAAPGASTPGRRIRRPAVAGTFYPRSSAELESTVDRLLVAASPPTRERSIRAIVVPHAGYAYSGPVAATGYVAAQRSGVTSSGQSRTRVVLLGPAHFVPLRGFAVPAADAWATPLGEVPIDGALRSAAVDGAARLDDRPHAPEHSLEVQLPFLQRLTAGRLSVLPVAVGVVEARAVADLVAALPADLVVVSTDLSHYLDERTAQLVDRRTLRAVLEGDAAAIEDDAACGLYALRGITEWAARAGLAFEVLAYGTSADAGGDRRSVVGYAALAIG